MRDSCDLEPAQVYNEELVVARRPHRCCETRRMIQPGERYWRISMLSDGRWWRYAQSWAAYRLARALNHNEGGTACWIPFGGLHAEIDHADEYDDADGLRAEWELVREGIITREPVGDEPDYLTRRGIDPPPVHAMQKESTNAAE
jgi:hypothetical protein